MKGASAAAIALFAGLALPASAIADTTTYKFERASGYERMTFQSDPATCANFGVCGDSGTVNYTFGGEPRRGSLVLDERNNGTVRGSAHFRTHGKTVASVTSTTGNTCKQTVRRTRERFSLNRDTRLGRLLFTAHPRPGIDLLATDCLTPNEKSLARTDALPKARFRARSFDHAETTLQAKGEAAFTDRGYRGEVRWKLSYQIQRR